MVMQRAIAIVNLTVIVTTLTVIATYFMPPPASWTGSWAGFHLPLALNIITPCLHLGGALLFLLSLSAYRERMRRAYTVMSLGIIITAIGSIELPIISAFDLWDSFIVTSGLVAIPLVLAGPFIYAGVRSFGLLITLRSRLSQLVLVMPGIVALIIAVSLLPHASSENSELVYDMSNAILLWTCLFDLAAAITILKVRQRMGAHYTKAMTWIAAALFVNAGILALNIINAFIAPSVTNAGTFIPYLVGVAAGVLWLKAGYEFMETKDV